MTSGERLTAEQLAQLNSLPAFHGLIGMLVDDMERTVSKMVETTDVNEIVVLVGRLRTVKQLVNIFKSSVEEAIKNLEEFQKELENIHG